MEIKKLGHNDTYTLKTADGCYTMFDEAIQHYDMGEVVELRVGTYVSGSLYREKAAEFLKLWEIEQCK